MRGPSVGNWLGYLLIPAAIWLGWQIVVAPIAQRAPPELALRVAPASPAVLARSAEIELAAGRPDNARDLAADSLTRAPFNLRALRTLGLVTAADGDVVAADDILTLAGNWSLRDTPSHGWLVDRRLRVGDYASSFAHADTLARRGVSQAEVFNLLITAAVQDPRAMAPLRNLLATAPPWDREFFNALQRRPGTESLTATLVAGLEQTPGRLSDPELAEIYDLWVRQNRFDAIGVLRTAIARPPMTPIVVDGDFSARTAIEPFGMTLLSAAGLSAEVVEDEMRANNPALRITYDGFGSGAAVEQLLLLPPGSYGLNSEYRIESGGPDARLSWQVRCVERAQPLADQRILVPVGPTSDWRALETGFTVPGSGCAAQWLRLVTRPGDRRAPVAVWLDNVVIERGSTP
ncbi:hypothetical protein [Brevundimonas sp.]|uniref:tetratricopeptide repeat protein n=1 Tax=Brevundimonas sp. TaxID=1871086 RepID=UPI002AC8AF65|nr:hypothetical protein [Brevundimonas sp.]